MNIKTILTLISAMSALITLPNDHNLLINKPDTSYEQWRYEPPQQTIVYDSMYAPGFDYVSTTQLSHQDQTIHLHLSAQTIGHNANQLSYIPAPPVAYTERMAQETFAAQAACDFMHNNSNAQQIYNAVNAELSHILRNAQSNNLHDRLNVPGQLVQLSTAYDQLHKECLVIGHKSQEAVALELKQKCAAVNYLQNELHNLTEALRQELYQKNGALASKPSKEFTNLISQYQQQYSSEAKYTRGFHSLSDKKLNKIETHELNRAIAAINTHLANGNLIAAEKIASDYNRTHSRQRYKQLVRECLHTNPRLNEFGIPKICAETNPNWNRFKDELIAHPERKHAVATVMHQQHAQAQNLCLHAGIQNASPQQLQQAHILHQYKHDPNFHHLAINALQNPQHFNSSIAELAQRATAINTVNNILQELPGSASILREHLPELLLFASDPIFEQTTRAMATNPTQAIPLLNSLGQRNAYVMHMRDRLGVEKFSDVAEQATYSLISVNNDRDSVNVLGQISSDSSNIGTRHAYETYYDQITHLPRTYHYDRQLTDNIIELKLPHALGTQEFVRERTCYTHVMLKPIASNLQREQAQQYLDILKQACTSGEHQEAFRALSHIAGQTYLNPAMQTNEHMRQQNIALFNTTNEAINSGDIATAANNMNMLQHELQSIGNNVITVPEQAQAFIQQHATVTVDEQRSTTQIPISSSSSTSDQQSAIDYAQLRDHAQAQHAAIFQKTGKISEQHLSRENALALMAQGDLSVQTKSYTLNTQAQQKLEKAGIDTRQFTECKGNLIQQDTHAKLVNSINQLAEKRPLTQHSKLISNGTTDCALAGMQLNKEGHIREAMLYSDLCTLVVERVLHVADNMNPFVLGTRALLDATTAGLHAASAHDLAESLDTLRTNINEFRTGFVSGALHGATNITNIYEGLCNTVEALGQFAQSAIAFNTEQEALTYAIESERYDDARIILAERTARAEQNAAAIHHLTGRITECINHIPDMTPQEWREAGFTTGDFVGRETAQLGAIHVSIRGLSRIGEGISNTIQNAEVLGRELALSAQLSGNPAAPSIADIVRQGHSVESVFMQNGSRFVSGIPSVHPEFGSPVLINAGKQFVEGATQVIAEGTSAAASQTAAILQLGTQLGNALTDAKPGFIQLPGSSKDIPATERVTEKVNNMKEFFGTSFGKTLKDKVQKTNYTYQGQPVYQVTEKISSTKLRKGDLIYLDGLHKDHLEAFAGSGQFRFVLNLNGTMNLDKTEKALIDGRSIKL